MSYETISLDVENRVATITINRPKMMNAFNEQLIWDMGDATEIVKNDSQILKNIGIIYYVDEHVRLLSDTSLTCL